MRVFAALIVVLFASSALVAGDYEVVAKAHSNGTKANGDRCEDTSAWSRLKLSDGEFFNPSDPAVYKVEWLGDRGDHGFDVKWEDYTEVFPGLKLPRTVLFRTWCKSPKVPPLSNIGVTGLAEAKLKIKSIRKPK